MSFPVMVPGNSLIPARLTTCRTDPWFPWWQSEKLQRLLGKSAAIYWTAIFWCKHTMMGWTRLNVHKFYFWTVSAMVFYQNCSENHTNLCNMDCCCKLKTGFPITYAILFLFQMTHPRAVDTELCMAGFHSFSLQKVEVAAWYRDFSSCFKGCTHKPQGWHELHVGCDTEWLKENEDCLDCLKDQDWDWQGSVNLIFLQICFMKTFSWRISLLRKGGTKQMALELSSHTERALMMRRLCTTQISSTWGNTHPLSLGDRIKNRRGITT